MSLNLIMGARNGAKTERQEHDYYATDPSAVKIFLNKLKEDGVELFPYTSWECACGEGHMAEVFKDYFNSVYSTDLVDRGYKNCSSIGNFLDLEYEPIYTLNKLCIATNPPFKYARQFCEVALQRAKNNDLVMMFVKIQFLEGKARKKLFEQHPPKYIYVYSERQRCALNGDFEEYKKGGRTQAYIWVIWEKGFKGEPVVRWI